MSFADFKKRSKSSIDELTKKIEETNKKESYKDDRFWKPELDKSSNGYAVIRFLPAVDGEDLPWAKYYSHGFQGKGGWFIENCPTTLGQKCPVCESNSELWNSGIEKDKDIARNRKRRLHYTANIMVVSDPANPQNEGKVFLYKFGKKIFDKINESMNPEFADEDAINPFDFWEGANFKLKVRKVAGYINYDKSEFDSPSSLFDGDDEKLEELWKSQYALSEFTDSSNFKSYDELKVKRDGVLGADIRQTTQENTSTAETVNDSSGAEDAEKSFGNSPEEDTDALSYFEKLANE
ncbi:single-stranded DNA-binding protein [Candidatus Pacearchaeota archaeon]|nr:single-stranded DNA-binding protein [Candidatus Pacearchaeota archaeon]